jgi:hypothetical protein
MAVAYEPKSCRTDGEGVPAVPLVARIARRDLTPDSAVDICEFSAVRQRCAQPLDQSGDLLRARLRCRLVAVQLHPASSPASTTPIATLRHIRLRRYTGSHGSTIQAQAEHLDQRRLAALASRQGGAPDGLRRPAAPYRASAGIRDTCLDRSRPARYGCRAVSACERSCAKPERSSYKDCRALHGWQQSRESQHRIGADLKVLLGYTVPSTNFTRVTRPARITTVL